MHKPYKKRLLIQFSHPSYSTPLIRPIQRLSSVLFNVSHLSYLTLFSSVLFNPLFIRPIQPSSHPSYSTLFSSVILNPIFIRPTKPTSSSVLTNSDLIRPIQPPSHSSYSTLFSSVLFNNLLIRCFLYILTYISSVLFNPHLIHPILA